MSSARALLFDFDGTLVDSSAVICRCFNCALETLGEEPMDFCDIRRMMGRPLREMFWRATNWEDVKRLDALVCAYRKAFSPMARAMAHPVPGVTRLIPLWAATRKLGIVTSRTGEGTEEILGYLQLRSFFGAIVGIEHVHCCKPDPEPVKLALDLLDVRPGEALMIGDTEFDILAARAAGVPAIGFALMPGREGALEEAGALAVVSDFEELSALLDG